MKVRYKVRVRVTLLGLGLVCRLVKKFVPPRLVHLEKDAQGSERQSEDLHWNLLRLLNRYTEAMGTLYEYQPAFLEVFLPIETGQETN